VVADQHGSFIRRDAPSAATHRRAGPLDARTLAAPMLGTHLSVTRSPGSHYRISGAGDRRSRPM